MADVQIYTKPGCPYCAAAKKHYENEGVEYDEFDVKSDNEIAQKAIKIAHGQRIVPVIVDNGKVKLGFGGG